MLSARTKDQAYSVENMMFVNSRRFFKIFLDFLFFAVSCFQVEEEHAAKPYAILRATPHVIVDPVAT